MIRINIFAKSNNFVLCAAVLLAIGLAACGGVAVNVQINTTPAATARETIPTASVIAQSDGLATRAPTSGLATRPPTTKRAVTRTPAAKVNGFQTVALEALPLQAQATMLLINRGGPYPYHQDGQVFQNREGLLPKQKQGYYHEYTVETPGSPDRGARRIIAGDQGEFYYTDDHYNSFKVILMNE